MLRSITFILILFAGLSYGQSKKSKRASDSYDAKTSVVNETAESALETYISKRNAYKRSNTKEFSRTEQFEMDDICHDMEKKFPDAWQTDFAWYINGHYYLDEGARLKKAYDKAPNDKRVVKAMFGYYIMNGDYGKQKELASKVQDYYSSNTLSYYEDVFPTSGAVIVSSEEEALPLHVLQLKKGKGKGVTIVNMDYLINEDYRKRMADELGTGSQKFFGEETTFISTALSSNKVFLSTTVPQGYLSKVSKRVFVTGLNYEKDIKDQKEKLKNFWSQVAKKNFASMSLTRSEKRLYNNYLPPLLTLYKLKVKAGEKDAKLRQAIVALAGKVGQTKTVDNILMEYENG